VEARAQDHFGSEVRETLQSPEALAAACRKREAKAVEKEAQANLLVADIIGTEGYTPKRQRPDSCVPQGARSCPPQRATAIDREDSQSSKRVGPRRG
jgi:hypothetical protein